VIQLGAFDDGVTPEARSAYIKELEATTRVPWAEVTAGPDKIAFTSYKPDTQPATTVAALQTALKQLGFFPGGKVDGICGYRTVSAIRLFQEYVRVTEKLPCVPDGRWGPQSQQHLQRWLDGSLTPDWTPTVAQWRAGSLGNTEYTAWLALLEGVKSRYRTAPSPTLQKVNANTSPTDTRKVADWDFSPAHVHLIGLRREEASQKFDDIFVALIKGLVYKFQGTTEPGAAKDPKVGAPFLVQGQHDYHFGWHQHTYLALRPQRDGVLVVRSRNDLVLDAGDLANGVQVEGSINVHWGGLGLKRDVNNWSEGCQVLAGTTYVTPKNDLVNCASFAAVNNAELASNPSKTRGAYNVLLDLVTAFGSDLPSPTVKYTLLVEDDLELNPALKRVMTDARALIQPLLG
jgi:hypothetical protein